MPCWFEDGSHWSSQWEDLEMQIDMQVKHLDATVRGLQDIHQELVSKAATCNGSFSNRQPTPPSFDWVVTWMLEPWHRWKRRSLEERQRSRIWSNRQGKWWGICCIFSVSFEWICVRGSLAVGIAEFQLFAPAYSWIFVGDVLGFGPTMFFGRWKIWRRLWQRRLRRWIAVRAKARWGRFAFCGHRFESSNLVRNSVTSIWEMLRAESVRRSPNWKKPSKQWRDGRKSSICRWWRWRAFCDGFEVVVLMLRVF